MKLWKATSVYLYVMLAFLLSGCSSCTEQHDPTGARARFWKEAKTANAPTEHLTDDYKLPVKVSAAEAAAANQDVGTAKFTQICSSCHGPQGKGDGAAAAAMNPKPRNFTDPAWQAKVTDEHIAQTIKNGGASVGLSGTMPAWGGVLNDAEIAEVVKKIRSFKP